jgi:translation initiation factor 1A
MPKNLKGGSKHKKMKNTSNSDEITQEHLVLKSGNDQDYGKVEKLLGNCRVSLLCNDKETRVGIIRGNMRKRQWLNIGSIVIYSMRAYEKNKVDIIHVYNNNVLKMLEKNMNLNFSIMGEEKSVEEDIFSFEDNDEITYEIPEKQKIKNGYYNFSDSDEEENNKSTTTGVIIDDDFINDI